MVVHSIKRMNLPHGRGWCLWLFMAALLHCPQSTFAFGNEHFYRDMDPEMQEKWKWAEEDRLKYDPRGEHRRLIHEHHRRIARVPRGKPQPGEEDLEEFGEDEVYYLPNSDYFERRK
eukprot:CAMPEP_0172450754 /NCGR_PEP_ID=MMETSP1065-20121228/8989_1 /TAXON_ID=265537 /ORGANISM="Amphiprora paludosa, Strain CCMP125" /LENGTH=116 /DNA_ID=CAMNT_0013202575 /DNA_START=113 /DNA_END=460 /DNA_ORIENTATION=+